MTISEQKAYFEKTTKKMSDIMLRKGNDYANEDRLSNFKLAGAIVGTGAEINCLNLIATKVARLGVLLNQQNKKPNNESIDDTLVDLANYSILLSMLIHERSTNGQ